MFQQEESSTNPSAWCLAWEALHKSALQAIDSSTQNQSAIFNFLEKRKFMIQSLDAIANPEQRNEILKFIDTFDTEFSNHLNQLKEDFKKELVQTYKGKRVLNAYRKSGS